MALVSLNAVRKSFGSRTVLDGLDFAIEPGARVGIVDLPEPFAPTTPTRAPGSIAKSSPSSTVRLPNDLRTALSETSATA